MFSFGTFVADAAALAGTSKNVQNPVPPQVLLDYQRDYNRFMSAQTPVEGGQVLYRKWRPQTFGELVGQEPVTRTLRNSVATGKLAHAYLLCGPRGTGKTSLGRLIAKAVNCESPREGEPCNECFSCRAFLEGRAPDLLEMDAASNRGIDEIRSLRERVGLAPMGGGRKVYLVDEVHMLTPEANNALLKTLEEPPPQVIFILATTEGHKVPLTIISRCQRFDLRRISLESVIGRLEFICQQEGFTLDAAALLEVARSAGGSLRDAINTLEQLAASFGPAVAIDQVQEMLGLTADARSRGLAAKALAGDSAGGLKLIAEVRDDGVDMRQFGRQVVRCLRDLLLVKSGLAEGVDASKDEAAELENIAGGVALEDIVRALRRFATVDFREDTQSPLPLELALLDITAAGAQPRPQAFAEPPAEAGAELVPNEATTQRAPPPEGKRLLEEIRRVCRDIDKQVAPLLNGSCEVIEVGEDALVLGVYFSFHLEKLEGQPAQRVLEDAASRVLGRPMTIRCQLMTGPPPAASKKSVGLAEFARVELGAQPLMMEGIEGGEVGAEGI